MSGRTQALVLFAHGARDAQWSEPFRAIRDAVAKRRPDLTVRLAYLESMEPALADCVGQLARDGHRRIAVAPLFLGRGSHLKVDLLRLQRDLESEHANVSLEVLQPIGEVTELLEAISDWLVGSVPPHGGS